MPVEYNHEHENEITLFAETNFRNARRRFGIKTDDRRRHLYIIGKTGMGKTVLQENMVMSDIMAGHGVCYVDPHGDTAEKILDYIPSNRINDVVYFNPADMEFPVGFNILETVNDNQKHLVASGLMGVFKKIWPDVWSPRMEYILLNCVLALLDYPGATLLGINRLLVDLEYRERVIAKIRDPIVKTFWVAEFSNWEVKYQTEAIAPIQNKVGQFLSASIVRNIVSQVKSTIDVRKIMDEGKIFIVNLSKGRIGEENMRLLGGMLISRLSMAAMERVDMPENERRDFYLFVDEFQNFANESFASILSEARKYRLSLTVAHQYVEQLTEEVQAAVIGNVGTILAFRVGSTDAEFLEKEFSPTFTVEDLVNLPKYTIYLKLMVDGVATSPFSATTLPPIAQFTGNAQKVIAVSRERYAMPRATIAEKVLRWSGMESASLRAPEGLEAAKEQLGGIPASMLEDGEPKRVSLSELESEGFDQDTPPGPEEYLKISPERLKALQKPPSSGGKKKDKPKFPHTCSRCGKVWEMPIQLDASRPMYCAECLPLVKDEQKMKGRIARSGPQNDSRAPVTSFPAVSKDRQEQKPGTMPQPEAKPEPPNRPRFVGAMPTSLPQTRPDDGGAGRSGDANRQAPKGTVNPKGLLEELERIKGRPVETNKFRIQKKVSGPSVGGMSEAAKRSQQPPIQPPAEPRHGYIPDRKDRTDKDKKPPSAKLEDYFSKIEDGAEPEPMVQEARSTPTVFRKSPSSEPTQSMRASTEYPAVPHKTQEANPLDKRQSFGVRQDASGSSPQSTTAPKTLLPGQKVTF